MAQRKSPWIPIVMLSLGVAGGWWLARQGLKLPEKSPSEVQTETPTKTPATRVDDKTGDTTPPATGPVVDSIRKVDFRNFRYTPECLRNEDGTRGSLTTQDGEFERNEEFDKLHFTVNQVIYGDLTGEGQPEAIVLTACNTGGSGTLTEGYVYNLQAGRAAEIARVDSGSKAYGGIVSLEITRGALIVERYATDEDGPHCCPKYIDSQRLRWNGATLVPDGNTTRRAAPASE